MQHVSVSLASAMLVSSIAVVASCGPQGQLELQGADRRQALVGPGEIVVPVVADTHVRGNNPDSSFGGEALLRVEQAGATRKSLVRFDAVALAAALEGRTLRSAEIALYTAQASNFPATGQSVGAFPMRIPWSEVDATFNCAIDTVPWNWAMNCDPGSVWDLSLGSLPGDDAAYGPPTDTTLVQNGDWGWKYFDVTDDVQAGLEHGWLIMRTNESLGGNVTFFSREHGDRKPELILDVTGACGDGTIDADNGEACDDGNVVNGDGCSARCDIESFCGDGVLDDGESCDDGNRTDGDGCDALCTIEPFCGDGSLDDGEACDDGNVVDADGCSSICAIESFCGDGGIDDGEGCDDGNVIDGDGCSASCAIESFCGDGEVDNGESCDDGNTVDGDGCSAGCAAESFCGDGTVDEGEVCDDGNTSDGDGCSADCGIETVDDAPRVVISLPTTGTVAVAGTSLLVVVGAVDDHAIASVELEVNGLDAPLHLERTETPYSFTVPVPAESIGTHLTIVAWATDNAGQQSAERSVVVLVVAEDEAPTVEWLFPSTQSGQASLGAGAAVTLEVYADDNVAVESVEFLLDGESLAIVQAAPWRSGWVVPDLPGTHTLVAVARDPSGNEDSAELALQIIGDRAPGFISFNATPTVVAGDDFHIAAQSSDDIAVVSLILYGGYDDQVIDGALPELDRQNNHFFFWTLTAPVTRTGQTFRAYVVAVDTRGQTTRSPTVEVSVLANQPPTATWIAPLSGSSVFERGTMRFLVDATDPENDVSSVTFFVNGVAFQTVTSPAGIAGFPGRYEAIFTVPAGAHMYEAWAVVTDGSGQQATSGSVTFRSILR